MSLLVLSKPEDSNEHRRCYFLGDNNVDSTSFSFDINNRLNVICDEEDVLFKEELQSLEDIKIGKTKMIRQSGKDFLKELNDIINE